MAKNYYDITLALAGVCQAARLVQQLAHQGHCDSDALHVSLNSIIDLDPESTLAVFGGSEANLRLGLETLLGVLNTSSRQGLNAELTRYTLSLMVLERKLAASKGAMDTLGNRIGGLRREDPLGRLLRGFRVELLDVGDGNENDYLRGPRFRIQRVGATLPENA